MISPSRRMLLAAGASLAWSQAVNVKLAEHRGGHVPA